MTSRFARSAGGSAEEPITILGRRSQRADGSVLGLSVRIESEDLSIAIGPGSLVDAVSRALTAHTADAIATGQRPSGGSQRPLDPHGTQGAEARAGRRPNARGNTGGPKSIPRTLTRGEIKLSSRYVTIPAIAFGVGPKAPARVGTSATAKIEPATALQAKYIDEEEQDGVELFAVDGAADRAIEAAVVDYLTRIYDGTRYYSTEAVRASEL